MFSSFPDQPPRYEMNSAILKDPLKKGSTSKIYYGLSNMEYMPTLDYLKEAWQKNLGVGITDCQWAEAQDNVNKVIYYIII